VSRTSRPSQPQSAIRPGPKTQRALLIMSWPRRPSP
jgi:hypothetical protein